MELETLDFPNRLNGIPMMHIQRLQQTGSLENALVTNIVALHYVYQTIIHRCTYMVEF